MFKDTEKFNKEIRAFKAANVGLVLHPLKKEQIKQAVLARLTRAADVSPASFVAKEEKRVKLISLISSIVLGLLMLGGTAFASGIAKPGDILFPVKKAVEQIRVNLTPTVEGKAQLQAKFAQERLQELFEINSLVNTNATGSPATEIRGQTQAQNEVKSAISDLKAAETNLQAKGNLNAASVVHQTVVQLQASVKENDSRESNSGSGSGSIGDNQKAFGTPATRLQAGQVIEVKKNQEQQKKSGNQNTGDRSNDAEQNGSASSTPVVISQPNQADSKDGQDNRQVASTSTSSPQTTFSHATSTPSSTGQQSGNSNAPQGNTNSQDNSSISSSGSNNQDSGSTNTGNTNNSPGNQGPGSPNTVDGNTGKTGNTDNKGGGGDKKP